MENDGIFTIQARRCKRCGGLLTSKQAVKDGYGHVCKQKIKNLRTRAAFLIALGNPKANRR